MQNPDAFFKNKSATAELNELKSLTDEILKILMNDNFYEKPTEEDAKKVKSYLERAQNFLKSKGEKNKYQMPATNLTVSIMMVDAIRKQEYNHFAIAGIRQSWCEVNTEFQPFLTKHPKEFCKLYLMGEVLNLPNYLENGQIGINQIMKDVDTKREEILRGIEDPFVFLQTAFSAKYNEAVKWTTNFENTVSAKVFTQKNQAESCIDKLKAIGIEECSLVDIEKVEGGKKSITYRVKIPNWRIIEAMEKAKQKQLQSSQNNTNRRPGLP